MPSELDLSFVAKKADIDQGDYHGAELAQQLRLRGRASDKRLWRLEAGVRSMRRRSDALTGINFVRHGTSQTCGALRCTDLAVIYWSPLQHAPDADSHRAWFAKLQVTFVDCSSATTRHRYQAVGDELAFVVSSRDSSDATKFTGWPVCDIVMPLAEAAWGRRAIRNLAGQATSSSHVLGLGVSSVQGFLDYLVMQYM